MLACAACSSYQIRARGRVGARKRVETNNRQRGQSFFATHEAQTFDSLTIGDDCDSKTRTRRRQAARHAAALEHEAPTRLHCLPKHQIQTTALLLAQQIGCDADFQVDRRLGMSLSKTL
ncbi:hypothetical protein HDG35_004052 [Paraburkholderia sp. JPY681]|nr:hypothetical protein [Paraburkholderia atlantica]